MKRAFSATLIMVTISLAGCAGEAEPEKDLIGTEASQDDSGTLHAMVFADYGAPLDGARVSMLGTIFSARTDEAGIAAFSNVPAGEYTLRIEMDRFLPAERPVRVNASEVNHEEVVLILADRSPGARTHIHDFWRSDTEVQIADAMMSAVPRYHTDHLAWWPEMGYNNPLNGLHRMNNNQTGEDPDYVWRIPVHERTPDDSRAALIYPGTSEIEVMVEWDNGAMTNVEQIGVAYIPPHSDELVVLGRNPSGGTWNIPVLPEQADSGHQRFSFWNLFLYSGNDSMGDPTGEPVQWSLDQPFHVTVQVRKGNVPYEAPHRDFWADGPVKNIVLESQQDIDPLAVRDWRVENSGHVFMPEDQLVPPGTKKMAIEYTYIHGDAGNNDDEMFALTAQPQTLTIRTADQNPWETPVAEYNRLEPTGECEDAPSWGTCIRYEFELGPGWEDAFYQQQSLWAFLTNVEGYEDERRFTPGGGTITMHLDITMYGPDA